MKLQYWLLLLIVIIGAFLRLMHIGDVPLWIDEAISLAFAKQVLETGSFSWPSGLWMNRSIVFHGILTVFAIPGSDVIARMPSVFFGLMTIVLAFCIGRHYSTSCGVMGALLVSLSTLEIFFSREARMYQLFQLLFFATIYTLYLAQKRPWMVFVSFALLLWTIDTHVTALVLGGLWLFGAVYVMRKYVTYWWSLGVVLLAGVGFLVYIGNKSTWIPIISSPMLWWHLKNHVRMSWEFGIVTLLVVGVIGVFFAVRTNRLLTLFIFIPTLITWVGVFFVSALALRYVYFVVFALLLFSGVLFGCLIDRYGLRGKVVSGVMILLLIVAPFGFLSILPSSSYVSSDDRPVVYYDEIPLRIQHILLSDDVTFIVGFSPYAIWYLRTPDYVYEYYLAANKWGINTFGGVDRYSGVPSPIGQWLPDKPVYIVADVFSMTRLSVESADFMSSVRSQCNTIVSGSTLLVFYCASPQLFASR